MNEEDVWDEDRWEGFLRANDARVSRLMQHFAAFLEAHPAPPREDAERYGAWERELRQYLVARGWPEDDGFLDLLQEEDEAPLPLDLRDLSEEDLAEARAQSAQCRESPPYQAAHRLTLIVLGWSNGLPDEARDSSLVQLCDSIVQVPKNLFKGCSLGFEREMIGGNIACTKRALHHANAALEALGELRGTPYLPGDEYEDLYEDLYELRNSIGLYVQDLRARFDLGVD